ncbi:MAG: response regulator transcription factor [Actinomycetes bacterium]
MVAGWTRLATLLANSQRSETRRVEIAGTSQDGLVAARRFGPDVLVVDVGMPDGSGAALVETLRAEGVESPALFLVSREESRNGSARRLTVGADQNLVKPFSLDEFDARIRIVVMMYMNPPEMRKTGPLRVADLELDEETGRVRRAGRDVRLAPIEHKILRYLMRNSDVPLSRAQIVDHVWPYDFSGDLRVLDVHISMLRRKIDRGLRPVIHTVHRLGYCVRG